MTKQVLITGSASGIGLATAHLLHEKGWEVIGLDVQPIQNAPWRQIQGLVDAPTLESIEVHALEGVFCNAGIHMLKNILQATRQEIVHIMNMNILSVIDTLRWALPRMQTGAIVLNASDQVRFAKGESGMYGMTKGAVANLAMSTALDFKHIRCNAILPGSTQTPLLDRVKNTLSLKGHPLVDDAFLAGRQLHNKLATPSQIASVVAFLLSPDSAFINGAQIPVDDGASIC